MADAVDRANDLAEREVSYALQQRELLKPTRPDHLLPGICISCAESIEPERYENNPRVERCITCQEILEKKRMHYRKNP